jgi:hypothetical protein
MSLPASRAVRAALVGIALLGLTALRADAQITRSGIPLTGAMNTPTPVNPNFRLPNGLTIPQAAFNIAAFGNAISQVPPYALGFNPYGGGGYGGLNAIGLGGYGGGASLSSGYGAGSSPYSAGGYGGGGGYGGYYEDPTAGYLRGTATLTTAQGNYYSQVQQARLLQAQADTAKLDLYRRIREDAAAERKSWLNPETERVRDLQAAYTRATHEPPITEVLSGQALNDLYNHIYPIRQRMRLQPGAPKGPDVPIDEDMLKQVNFTGMGSGGSVGILKDRGRLTWPLVLQSPEFDAPRKELGTLAADAVEQVRLNNPVGAATLRDMQADVRRMNDTLLREAGDVSPSDYVEAKRYLSSLESAIKALQDPNVGSQLNQNWAPRVKDVAALIDFMGQKGLKFAPATAGDEPAYRHVYQRLLAYDSSPPELVAK